MLKCKSSHSNNCQIIIYEGSFSEKIIPVKNSNPLLDSLDLNFVRAKITIPSKKSRPPFAFFQEVPLRIPVTQGYLKKIGDSVCE